MIRWFGNYRCVYIVGAYAFKVPKRGNLWEGWKCNRRERRLWRLTKSDFLVPTIFSFGGLVNVQPRCIVLADICPDKEARKIARPLYCDSGISDIHPGNVGYCGLKGLQIFDYAG